MKHLVLTTITAVVLVGYTSVYPNQPTIAFPGAEGYGRFAKGGRGGDVYIVINLNDDGPGSLRYGIENMNGPRTIVFSISGTIELKDSIKIKDSNLTIAGQTARVAATLLLDNDSHPEAEIDQVTTPMGATIAGLNEMEHQGFSSAMIRGITTSTEKVTRLFKKR